MDKNKYIEVLDHYAQLLEEHTITDISAWWGMHAVVLCAQKDYTLSGDDYAYILGYREHIFGIKTSLRSL